MEQKKSYGLIKKAGFLSSYLLFNTIAYFALRITDKLPENYTWFHLVPFTLFILLLGVLIKQLGK